MRPLSPRPRSGPRAVGLNGLSLQHLLERLLGSVAQMSDPDRHRFWRRCPSGVVQHDDDVKGAPDL
jgi:hypothetical protein